MDKTPVGERLALAARQHAYGEAVVAAGPSFAYSRPVHSFHTRRDRVASLPPCRLRGAAIPRASSPGPGRALTLPCGWDNAGCDSEARVRQAAALAASMPINCIGVGIGDVPHAARGLELIGSAGGGACTFLDSACAIAAR